MANGTSGRLETYPTGRGRSAMSFRVEERYHRKSFRDNTFVFYESQNTQVLDCQ